MRELLFFIFFALLGGCAHWWEDGRLTQEGAVALFGEEAIAVTLSPYPQPSGCTDPRCLELDRYEAQLYADARSGKITWLQLVDSFYLRRAMLFPNVSDDISVLELRRFQRAQAVEMDDGRIDEKEWVERNDRKFMELMGSFR